MIMVDHADVLSRRRRSGRPGQPDRGDGRVGLPALLIAARDRALIDDMIRAPYRHLTLGPVPDLADSRQR